MDGSAEGLEKALKGKKIIEVSASTLVDLKAELFLAQQRAVEEQQDPTLRARAKAKSKKNPSWLIKKNKGVNARIKRDAELSSEERQSLAKAAAKLAAKAKLYEKMSRGELSREEQETFLVDFERKQLEAVGIFENGELAYDRRRRSPTPPPANEGEEWVDYKDAFGRTRRCMRRDLPKLQQMDRQVTDEDARHGPTLLSDDMRREMERERWEEQARFEQESGPMGPTHYQGVRAQEIRTLGTGYFAFSKDEDERAEQMKMLSVMRDQTVDQRKKRDRLQERRKQQREARLAKIKRRKLGEGAGAEVPLAAPAPKLEPESEAKTMVEDTGLEQADADEPTMSTVDELLSFYRRAVEAAQNDT